MTRPRGGLGLAILVLATIGLGIATYLTVVHYAGLHVACLANGGCETVQASRWAELGGVPVATLGLVGYALILASLFVRGETGRFAGSLLALIGFLFSAYLTFREVFTIEAICQWCVGSAVIMTALAVLTTVRLLRTEDEPAIAAR